MWVALVIVVLAVLMIVGPLMAIRPTKSQNRLAGLRQLALKEGLSVRMRQDPSAYNNGLVAVYTYYLPGHKNNQAGEAPPQQKSVRKANRWLLARREYQHELHFQGEWDWLGDERPLPPLQNFLKDHLLKLDGSFLAVESSGHGFGLYWAERLAGKSAGQRIEEIASWLRALAQHEPVFTQQSTGSLTGDSSA